MIIKMTKELRNRMDAHSKKLKFLTKRENITTNQTEMKSTITKEDTKMNL